MDRLMEGCYGPTESLDAIGATQVCICIPGSPGELRKSYL